jgi:hypothetical protein
MIKTTNPVTLLGLRSGTLSHRPPPLQPLLNLLRVTAYKNFFNINLFMIFVIFAVLKQRFFYCFLMVIFLCRKMHAWVWDDQAILLLKTLIPRKGELLRSSAASAKQGNAAIPSPPPLIQLPLKTPAFLLPLLLASLHFQCDGAAADNLPLPTICSRQSAAADNLKLATICSCRQS